VTPRSAVRLAWGLWGLAAALMGAAMVLGPWLLPGYVGFQVVLSLAFVTVGAFLGGRRPGNPVGWLLLCWGIVMAFSAFVGAYVERGLVRDPGSLPGPDWAAWAEAVVWHPAFGLLAFLLLLFPHGRLPSRRWRPFAWVTVAAYLTLSLSAAAAPGAVEAFSGRLRHQVDLDTLSAELLAVVDHTVQPTRASLWLRPGPSPSARLPVGGG
jgi:hypothetical protein